MPSFNLDDYVVRCGSEIQCLKCDKVLKNQTKYNIKRHYAIIHGEKFGEHGSFSGSVGKKKYVWRASSADEFNIDSHLENNIGKMGIVSHQSTGSAEKPKEYVVVGDPSASAKASKDRVTKENQETSSKLKNPPQNVQSTPKEMETVPIADIGVQNYIKSFGLAISKGLEALPADVAIDFALDVLKNLNKKVHETKFEQNKKDNNANEKHIAFDSDENDEYLDSESDAEMDHSVDPLQRT